MREGYYITNEEMEILKKHFPLYMEREFSAFGKRLGVTGVTVTCPTMFDYSTLDSYLLTAKKIETDLPKDTN